MTNEQLIEKFNPLNGANLSAEDLETMRNLTDEQIDALANAYPNQPNRKAYLRLYDKNVAANKQLFNLSTWQNLRNLRKFNAKKNLVPYDFFNVRTMAVPSAKTTGTIPGAKSPKKVVVDMSAKDAAAELAKNVENPPPGGPAKKETKPAKAATGAKKGGTKPPLTVAPPDVDKEGISQEAPGGGADTEFTDGQGE